MHKPTVAHRDLSSSNVLVKADGTCALSDFSCSTILHSCSGHRHRQCYTRNVEDHAQIGTLRYVSPEILEGSVNLSGGWCLMQGDVYALGLLLWEIWMRCTDLFEGSVVPEHLLPYEYELGTNVTLESLIVYVSHMDKRPSIPQYWDLLPQGSAQQELMTGCWDHDPDARLTAQTYPGSKQVSEGFYMRPEVNFQISTQNHVAKPRSSPSSSWPTKPCLSPGLQPCISYCTSYCTSSRSFSPTSTASVPTRPVSCWCESSHLSNTSGDDALQIPSPGTLSYSSWWITSSPSSRCFPRSIPTFSKRGSS
ncbi:hypothetical protein LDENG_00169440 [Lucifuga dentata]|nr:hypothetical protein LDENG_00169440 [Lucifuga dentata]